MERPMSKCWAKHEFHSNGIVCESLKHLPSARKKELFLLLNEEAATWWLKQTESKINCLLNKEKLYLLDTASLNKENNCFYVC